MTNSAAVRIKAEGKKTTKGMNRGSKLKRRSKAASARNGLVKANRIRKTSSALLDNTFSLSNKVNRLMNDGLVTKNNHSKNAQAVAITKMMLTIFGIFIVVGLF
jgi:hypothetical protein